MNIYTVIQGATPFNWLEFLNKASAKKISSQDFLKAKNLSESWVTCACGNQCDTILRLAGGRPDDRKLEELGLRFWRQIKNRKWADARRTLFKIDDRSWELISAIISEKLAKLDEGLQKEKKTYESRRKLILDQKSALKKEYAEFLR